MRKSKAEGYADREHRDLERQQGVNIILILCLFQLEIQRLNREGVRKELLKLSAGEGHEANARRRKEKAELMLEKKVIT